MDAPGSKVPGSCQAEAPLVGPQKTDILFVIDNSGSMAEEQDGLARELPAFIEELEKGGGTAHDFQVGVITTAVYQNARVGSAKDYREFKTQSGRLQAVGDERILGSTDPDLVQKFAQLVKQGTDGSGQETPFEAIRLAVTDLAGVPLAEGGNAGFLRDGARLLVVVVSDEDDCSELTRPPVVEVGTQSGRDYCTEQSASLGPVQAYVDIFKGLKDGTGAHREVLWAAIAPVSVNTKQAQSVVVDGVVRNIDCPTSYQPGYRQREMAEQFDAALANLDSICRDSYRDTLLAIAQIANSRQSLEVDNVPDPRLLKVEVTRADGEVQVCTLANGGITFDEGSETHPSRVQFTESCPRRASDLGVSLKMLCAG
ncbi:MAG: VWA domain-containing protein [Myxococcaceae bacterium]